MRGRVVALIFKRSKGDVSDQMMGRSRTKFSIGLGRRL